jgi:hypothetical protein
MPLVAYVAPRPRSRARVVRVVEAVRAKKIQRGSIDARAVSPGVHESALRAGS